jgi:Leucine-rich repeat (LRR) protein
VSIKEAEARMAGAIAARADTLDLRALGLKELPPLPSALRQLRVIELGSNRLKKLPLELLELRALQRLGLGNNRLQELPADLFNVLALVSLDLSENQLAELPSLIGQLSRLVEVSLYGNFLRSVPAALFALTRLERLDLSTNRLAELPEFRSPLSRLQVLDLSQNDLQWLPASMGQLTSLRVLNLSKNKLTSVGALESLALLEDLNVADNRLVSLPDGATRGWRRVESTGNPLRPTGALRAADPTSLQRAAAAINALISGGPSQDARNFDVVPYQFDFSLDFTGNNVDPLIDLYYKGFQGQDVSLQMSGGSVLPLSSVTRTKALDLARAFSAAAPDSPVRVRLGGARSDEDKVARNDFAAAALTRIPGAVLAPAAQEQPASRFSSEDAPLPSVLPQWSRRTGGDASADGGAAAGSAAGADGAARTVGVGFAAIDEAAQALAETEPLPASAWLWLWCTVEAGTRIEGAVGGGQALSAAVFEHADLEVAVFANPDGFGLDTCTGVLRLHGAGSVVLRPAAIPRTTDPTLASRRLFFRIKTPQAIGREQLRVHLYHRGLLVQALNISAWIGASGSCPDPVALTVTSDYVLSKALSERQLLSLGEHTLSILVNESPREMRGFRFFGADGAIASSATIEATRIGQLLSKARCALRLASWGSEAPFDPNNHSYRYEEAGPLPDFKEDLVQLAKCGFELWDALVKPLAGGQDADLQSVMRRSGVVQLSLKESSTLLLPLAILYDKPIDSRASAGSFSICPEYAQGPDCFAGSCPHSEDPTVVCPSAFWGFRHSIGVPLGAAAAPDAMGTVGKADMGVVASVYAGNFPLRDEHLGNLERLIGAARFEKKLTRKDTLARMHTGGFQLLYFYCHGGISKEVPFVIVGGDDEDPNQIARDTLRFAKIKWTAPHALVFINGCHTTEMEPAQAIDLVNGFVETAQASGVIGTEVTVFEPLATKIGEAFFKGLLEGNDVGTALRNARRSLLIGPRPNPLGLAYIPFALATLKFEDLAPSIV